MEDTLLLLHKCKLWRYHGKPKPPLVHRWAMYQHDPEHTGYQPLPAKYLVGIQDIRAMRIFSTDLKSLHSVYYVDAECWKNPVVDKRCIIYVYMNLYSHRYSLIDAYTTDLQRVKRKTINNDYVLDMAIHPYDKLIVLTRKGFLKCMDMDLNEIWSIWIDIWQSELFNPNIMFTDDCLIICPTQKGRIYIVDIHGKIKAMSPALEIDPFCVAHDRKRGIIYAVGQGNNGKSKLYAFDMDLNVIWNIEFGKCIRGGLSIASNGDLFLGGYDTNKLWCITPEGIIRWSYDIGTRVYGQPAIHPEGYVLIGAMDGYLYCFDLDGHYKWKHKAHTTPPSAPTIDKDGYIYTAGEAFVIGSYQVWKYYKLDVDGNTISEYEDPYEGTSPLAIF